MSELWSWMDALLVRAPGGLFARNTPLCADLARFANATSLPPGSLAWIAGVPKQDWSAAMTISTAEELRWVQAAITCAPAFTSELYPLGFEDAQNGMSPA